ncbi:MAG TPA: hypothetical protein VF280_04095 [Burkholderiales bacterium]
MATLGSRSLFHTGNAVRLAAQDALDKLNELKKELGVPTSATSTSRVTRTWPVSVSTSTSAPLAPTIQNGVALSVRPFASGDL